MIALLTAFQHQVEVLHGNRIPRGAAEELIQFAQEIVDLLGGLPPARAPIRPVNDEPPVANGRSVLESFEGAPGARGRFP